MSSPSALSSCRFSSITPTDLTSRPGHPDGVGVDLARRLDDLPDRLLDAEVVHLVAVVGEDDVDEVLADVVHVTRHRRQDDLRLRGGRRPDPLHVRLEVRHRLLHHLRRLQHERQLHLAASEELADDLHPGEQVLVDDLERRVLLEGFVEVRLQALLLAVDDVTLQTLLDREGLQVDRSQLRASSSGKSEMKWSSGSKSSGMTPRVGRRSPR